jgi:MYXO-CTERM domain-containing protein
VGYAAAHAAEIGELIQFAGTGITLNGATIVMDTWSAESPWETVGTSTGYNIAMTLNIYAVNNSGVLPEPGALLATVSQTAFIPWRPEASGGCGNPNSNLTAQFLGSDSVCHDGIAFLLNFNLPNVIVPDQVIWGLAFNTLADGYNPVGTPGPQDSLNLGFTTAAPSIGSMPAPGTAYLYSTVGLAYFDGGLSGTGTFRQDQGWAPYTADISFDGTTPEPGPTSCAALGLMALGLFGWKRRRSSRPTA